MQLNIYVPLQYAMYSRVAFIIIPEKSGRLSQAGSEQEWGGRGVASAAAKPHSRGANRAQGGRGSDSGPREEEGSQGRPLVHGSRGGPGKPF